MASDLIDTQINKVFPLQIRPWRDSAAAKSLRAYYDQRRRTRLKIQSWILQELNERVTASEEAHHHHHYHTRSSSFFSSFFFLASLGSNLDGGGWTSWSIAWLSLEFSGAIAAVLVLLLLQTICDNNRDLREEQDRPRKPFSLSLQRAKHKTRRTRDTVHTAQQRAAWLLQTCRLGNAVRTLSRERSSGGSHGASFFFNNYFIGDSSNRRIFLITSSPRYFNNILQSNTHFSVE